MIQKKLVGDNDLIQLLIRSVVNWSITHSTYKLKIDTPNISQTVFENLTSIMRYHQLSAAAYDYFKTSELELFDKLQPRLKQVHYSNVRNNLFLEDQYSKLLKVFHLSGITILPIKGMHMLLSSKGSICNRPMCDIDFLVQPDDIEQCQQILLKNGFHVIDKYNTSQDYWRTHQMHLEFEKYISTIDKKLSVEMHWALDYPRKYPVLSNLWKRIKKMPHAHGEHAIMTHEDFLFVIALHQRRFGSFLQLKYVVDVGRFFLEYGDSLDVSYIVDEADRSKLNSVLYALLQQTSNFYQNPTLDSLMNNLNVRKYKKVLIAAFQKKYQYIVNKHSARRLFAMYHFLLFDSFLEPYLYMLFIPYEQFCKYHKLSTINFFSRIKYEVRHFYGIYRLLTG